MKTIIITDLTRFTAKDIVCSAGTDMDSGRCLRPMPYLPTELCMKLGLLPGAILTGDFEPLKGLTGPHQEDAAYTPKKLKFEGPSTSKQFKNALQQGIWGSVEEGFEIELAAGQKHIPIGHPVTRSIITLAVDARSIEIVEDSYKPGKTKIHFVDGSGRRFTYFPITDLGFHNYADTHRAAKDLVSVNEFVRSQPEALLRLGLSRGWENPRGVNGYWMQVNGIYTFPNFLKELRSYK